MINNTKFSKCSSNFFLTRTEINFVANFKFIYIYPYLCDNSRSIVS